MPKNLKKVRETFELLMDSGEAEEPAQLDAGALEDR